MKNFFYLNDNNSCLATLGVVFFGGMVGPVAAEGFFVNFSTGPNMFSTELLTKTARDFLGSYASSGDIGLETEGFALAGKSLSIGWRKTYPIRQNLAWVSTVSTGYYRFTDDLEDGISVFIDPARGEVSALYVDAKAGLRFEPHSPARFGYALEGYVAMNASAAEISITSAVLNIQNDLTSVQPYVGAEAGLRFDAFPMSEPWISVQSDGGDYRELSVGLRHRF